MDSMLSPKLNRPLNPRQQLFMCAPMLRPSRGQPIAPARAFTLLELLVVIGLIAMLAALLLPTLSRTKSDALSTVCLNNLKQLQLAWEMYAADHGDALVPNWDGPVDPSNPDSDWISTPGSWVLGNAQLDATA